MRNPDFVVPAGPLTEGAQLSRGERGTWALVPPHQRVREYRDHSSTVVSADWREDVRAVVRAHLADFVANQCVHRTRQCQG